MAGVEKMANELIVISPITRRQGFIDEYEDQLAAAEIEFYPCPIMLDDGIASITARWKINFIRSMCQRFQKYSRLVFTDGWDVLFYGSKQDLVDKLPSGVLVSAERNCWPERDLTESLKTTSRWSYCNPGMLSGSPERLMAWTTQALRMPDLDIMEQAWFNRRADKGDIEIIRDLTTAIFYTVSRDLEDGSLEHNCGLPWGSVCNAKYGTYPHFFHFSGKCPSVPFRAMLRGRTKSLCASAS
jgi:hypothetical protein